MGQNIKAFLKNIAVFFLMAFSWDKLIIELTLFIIKKTVRTNRPNRQIVFWGRVVQDCQTDRELSALKPRILP